MIPDYDRAARMAYKSLLALKIESLPVDPLTILRHCKNTIVRTYDEAAPLFGYYDPFTFKWEVMQNQDAMTIRKDLPDGGSKYELLYYAQGNPFRRRFTLAHELGHIIMKHRMEEWWEEKEADYFAAQLLAPHPVLALFSRYDLNEADPELIGKTFGLSKTASEVAVQPPRHHKDAELYWQIQASFEPYIEIMSIVQPA